MASKAQMALDALAAVAADGERAIRSRHQRGIVAAKKRQDRERDRAQATVTARLMKALLPMGVKINNPPFELRICDEPPAGFGSRFWCPPASFPKYVRAAAAAADRISVQDTELAVLGAHASMIRRAIRLDGATEENVIRVRAFATTYAPGK